MADLDLAELRRSVDDALQRPGGGIVAVLPEALLALLDRLEAAEARTVELVNELDDERVAYAELLAELPGAVAGEPGGERAPDHRAEPGRCDAPWRTSAGLVHQCNRWVLHDGGACSCRCGFTWPTPIRQPDPLTAPVVAGEPEEIGREAAAEALAAFTRAADTQEAHDAH